MKKPNPATYLLGNPASVFAIVIVGGLLIFQWWNGQVPSDWVPVIAFFAVAAAGKAHERLAAYQNWKRAWDVMGGVASTQRVRVPPRLLGAVVLWLGCAAYLYSMDHRQPDAQLAIICFAVGSLSLAVILLYRRGRSNASRRSRSRKEMPVSISVSVPRSSPGARQFRRDLPAYCSRLV